MKKFEGSLVAEVTIKVPVRLGRVYFDSIGDVIHDPDNKLIAADQVESYISDLIDSRDNVEIDRIDLDVEMDNETQRAYDRELEIEFDEYEERARRYNEIAN